MLQRPSAESAKTRGASASEPAALKVQLDEVGLRGEGTHFRDLRCRSRSPVRMLEIGGDRIFWRLWTCRQYQQVGWHLGGAEPNLQHIL